VKQKSKRQKGNDFQIYIKNWLEKKGWLVRNFPTIIKPLKIKGKLIFVSQNQDFWGADLVCRKIENGQITQLYIQASLDSGITKRLDEFYKYFKKLTHEERLQIWIKTDKGEINIKDCYVAWDEIRAADLGKIIRKKYFKAEGINFEF